MMILADKFDLLFAGRRDAWGTVEGSCVKRELSQVDWQRHLNSDGSVGVYPMIQDDTTDWLVKWGCVDIDLGEELLVLAENLKKVLAYYKLNSYIEKSKGKGYHVWVFMDPWVEAWMMRRALLAASHIAGVPPKEINPKQEYLAPGQWGNYVNAPYALTWAEQGTRVVLNGPVYFSAQGFVDDALANLNDEDDLAALAALYKVPTAKVIVLDTEPSEDIKPLYSKLGPLAKTVFKDGPLPDRTTGQIDRSNGLARLAHLCAEDGLAPEETMVILVGADANWGKFNERPDGDEQLMKLVYNAYE